MLGVHSSLYDQESYPSNYYDPQYSQESDYDLPHSKESDYVPQPSQESLHQLNARRLIKKLSSKEYVELTNESVPLMTNMHSTNTQRKKVITTQAHPPSEPKGSSTHLINSIQHYNKWLSQQHHITDKTIKKIDSILDEYKAHKTEPNVPRAQALQDCSFEDRLRTKSSKAIKQALFSFSPTVE